MTLKLLFKNLIKHGICLLNVLCQSPWLALSKLPSSPFYLPSGPEWYLVRVELTVTDVNDNIPEWSMVPSPYLAVVSPDAPAGSLVYKLHAQDGDEGNNGEVEYFLSDGRSFFLYFSCMSYHLTFYENPVCQIIFLISLSRG